MVLLVTFDAAGLSASAATLILKNTSARAAAHVICRMHCQRAAERRIATNTVTAR